MKFKENSNVIVAYKGKVAIVKVLGIDDQGRPDLAYNLVCAVPCLHPEAVVVPINKFFKKLYGID